MSARDGAGPGVGRVALSGVVVAGVTALVSGISVFVNSYGVHAVRQPALYTTAKNLVAALLLAAAAVGVLGRRRGGAVGRFLHAGTGAPPRACLPESRARRALWWAGLAYVGIVGGGLAFVLFFDGLADTTAAPAAFWHDTLVVWVALLGAPFLRERPTWWNFAAVAVLVGGEVAITGGIGHLAGDRGELLVLAATVLWAVEVVVAKVVLRSLSPGVVALARMGVGALTLVAYLIATGTLGGLVSLDAGQVGWVLLTGTLLACYVGTWMTALARARAVDVTSILVAGALITSLLQVAAGTTSFGAQVPGLVLVALGTGAAVAAALRRATSAQAGATAQALPR